MFPSCSSVLEKKMKIETELINILAKALFGKHCVVYKTQLPRSTNPLKSGFSFVILS